MKKVVLKITALALVVCCCMSLALVSGAFQFSILGGGEEIVAEASPVEASPEEASPEEATPAEASPVELATDTDASPVEASPEEASPVEEPEEEPSIWEKILDFLKSILAFILGIC